jgi:hypothetical protein
MYSCYGLFERRGSTAYIHASHRSSTSSLLHFMPSYDHIRKFVVVNVDEHLNSPAPVLLAWLEAWPFARQLYFAEEGTSSQAKSSSRQLHPRH